VQRDPWPSGEQSPIPTRSSVDAPGGAPGTAPRNRLRDPPAPAVQAPVPDLCDLDRINSVLDELYALPGLESVAWRVRQLAELVMVDRERHAAGLTTTISEPPHLLFLGPPGTGKTTVARIIGRVYCALGLLPGGHLVEVDRSGLVAGYIGQTAERTNAVVNQAIGGVLFIDEAYSLVSDSGSTDFGHEAIEILLKRMEDLRGKFALIAAGYEAPMRRFLASNPGLESRFGQFIDFPHYSAEALVRIAHVIVERAGFKLDPGATDVLHRRLARLVANPPESWGNARAVRNIIDAARLVHAHRISAIPGKHTTEVLETLVEQDIAEALDQRYPLPS
jgi:SpoVK/Ycf46/Vps4 family AAA+-type ATPase